MAAALECWSGRPSTDEDMVEQVLMTHPHRSDLTSSSSSSSASFSNPSSPSHHHPHSSTPTPLPNKKWQRIGRTFTNRIASFKSSLSLDPSSSSSSKLHWGSVVRNLTHLYPGSQLPDKLISDLRHHFDSLPSSYSLADFPIADVLLHLRLLDHAHSLDLPAVHIHAQTLTFACSSSLSWPSVSAAVDSLSFHSFRLFDHRSKNLLLGVVSLSLPHGSDPSLLRTRIDSAFRSAAKKPRSTGGVKLPFGLCGCQEENSTDADPAHLPCPLPQNVIPVSVDDTSIRCRGPEDISRWVLGRDEVEFGDRAGTAAFKGCCRGKRVWIKKVRGCGERGTAYEVEIRHDLLQLMSCGQRNILRLVGICVDEVNGLCVVTKLMDAGSVRDWILKGRSMGMREVTRVATDVAEGLMFMNEHGVAYRDLNAGRILMDKQGNACLGDMGVVSSCGTAGEVTEYETAGYRWLAPEIISGDPESVTETWMSNVYSFGMVIWEMVTGEAAYSSYSPVQAAVGIAACGLRPEIPKDCPQVLRSLMMKCWNHCPSKRPKFSEIISILQKQSNR